MWSRPGVAVLPAIEPFQRLGLRRRAADLDDRDVRLAAAGRRGAGALPLGRQAGVAVARGNGRGPFCRDLRRRPALDAPTLLVLALGAAGPGWLDARRLALLLRVVGR